MELTPAQYQSYSRARDDTRREMDTQFAWVRQILAESHRNPKARARPFKIPDFLLFPEPEEARKEMSPDEQLAYVRGYLHPLFTARHKAEEARRARQQKKE